MWSRQRCQCGTPFWAVALATASIASILHHSSAKFQEGGLLPEFTGRIPNNSAPIGRDVTFTCNVKNLGIYRVAWVKADSKTIQAIHDAVITHNRRVSISGDLFTTFNLHIAQIEEKDRGEYMCQINTDPMTYQTAYLDVMVPPDITQSTTDLELQQGETANLECRADGYPSPTISWRREEDLPIRAKDRKSGSVKKYRRYSQPVLSIPRVTPDDMGAYMCIAKNTVPPAQSKRVFVYVQFPPTVTPTKRLVGAPYGQRAILKCAVRAFPKPIVYWNNTRGMIHSDSGGRYEVSETQISPFEVTSTLSLLRAERIDEGKYSCVAKNSLNVAHSVIRVYMVATPAPPPPATTATTSEYEEDDNEGEEKEERTRTANDGGGLGRGKFIGSADDGRIGPETEGESTRTVGEGKRSRRKKNRRKDASKNSVFASMSTSLMSAWKTTFIVLLLCGAVS